jgi:ribose/xylose/arabinose/galactoside ABC-type transport system permease subunit
MGWGTAVVLLLKLRAVLVLAGIADPVFGADAELPDGEQSFDPRQACGHQRIAGGGDDLRCARRRHRPVRGIGGRPFRHGGGRPSDGRAWRPSWPGAAVAVLIALLVSGMVGLLNGVMVTRLGVAPFIATLGTLYIARGAALLLSQGKPFRILRADAGQNTGFRIWGRASCSGIPFASMDDGAIAGMAAVVARRTPFGRHVYAVGGNERAARLSGIRVERVKISPISSPASAPGWWGW